MRSGENQGAHKSAFGEFQLGFGFYGRPGRSLSWTQTKSGRSLGIFGVCRFVTQSVVCSTLSGVAEMVVDVGLQVVLHVAMLCVPTLPLRQPSLGLRDAPVHTYNPIFPGRTDLSHDTRNPVSVSCMARLTHRPDVPSCRGHLRTRSYHSQVPLDLARPESARQPGPLYVIFINKTIAERRLMRQAYAAHSPHANP